MRNFLGPEKLQRSLEETICCLLKMFVSSVISSSPPFPSPWCSFSESCQSRYPEIIPRWHARTQNMTRMFCICREASSSTLWSINFDLSAHNLKIADPGLRIPIFGILRRSPPLTPGGPFWPPTTFSMSFRCRNTSSLALGHMSSHVFQYNYHIIDLDLRIPIFGILRMPFEKDPCETFWARKNCNDL